MVFSSIQAYLDPANWQQHPQQNNYQTGAASGTGNTQLLPLPLPPPPPAPSHGGAGSIRPGSMTDRARLANIPMPEAAVKCPRCESTNTKFCYYNNYSLSQPRHFCKTCRRYWTRGGALRNVPVGGGCRRNRRSKSSGNNNTSSSHKSQESINGIGNSAMAVGPTSAIGPFLQSNYSGHHESILGQMLQPMRFMAPPNLHQLNDFTNSNNNMSIFSNYGGISGLESGSFQIGSSLAGGSLLTGPEQWRSQQLQPPQLALLGGNNIDSSTSSGFYQFESGVEQSGKYIRPKIPLSISSSLATQLGSVKLDESSYKWDGAGSSASSWTDRSNFSSSSTGNPL